MKTLELKHIAPYYSNKLKVLWSGTVYELDGIIGKDAVNLYNSGVSGSYKYISDIDIQEIKPILRNLPDLTKEIEHNGERLVPEKDLLEISGYELSNFTMDEFYYGVKNKLIPYEIVEKLFEWHFDVFGLIEAGLAVDINTLNEIK